MWGFFCIFFFKILPKYSDFVYSTEKSEKYVGIKPDFIKKEVWS